MNNKGFTLIELTAVIVIVGVMFAVARKHYIDIEQSASYTAISAGLTELNSRENLTWVKLKINNDYIDDPALFGMVDTSLGVKYTWTGLNISGGTLNFNQVSHGATRVPSAIEKPARWN